jgi:isoleucyl-tRNA synthetase
MRTRAKKGDAADDPNDPANMYRDTVILPKTGFDQRANAPVREPQIQEFWETEGVYQRLFKSRSGEGCITFDQTKP